MNMKHTELPWKTFHGEISNQADALIARVYSGTESAALLSKSIGAAEADRNADFIVRACNAHAELVANLNLCVHYLSELNGSEWITGSDAGSVDMRQRALGLQKRTLDALAKAKTGK